MPLDFTFATEQDCATLAPLASKNFCETFGHLYRPENLAAHLEATCSEAYFRKAIAAGDSILLAELDGTLIGYGKAGAMGLPYAAIPEGAKEIHRCYIDTAHHGRGYGKALMEALLALPMLAHAPAIFLGVWEENLRAQALYRRFGFREVGRYLYQVVDQFDREIIMMRTPT